MLNIRSRIDILVGHMMNVKFLKVAKVCERNHFKQPTLVIDLNVTQIFSNVALPPEAVNFKEVAKAV